MKHLRKQIRIAAALLCALALGGAVGPTHAADSALTAIDILLDPGDAMLTQATADNARLRENYPQGFPLDATHTPHITVLQRMVFQPMLELLAYLRANGFKTFIVSARRHPAAHRSPPPGRIGNSDGDLEMLRWTTAGSGAWFALIVHHTDAEREWTYDRTSFIGQLDKAWDEAGTKNWTVVDVKQDWRRVFPFEQ